MDLGEGLRQALAKLKRATIIDAKTIREFNKDLQKALLSADVNVKLVLDFTKKIEKNVLESKLPPGVAPRDYITNLVYEGLVELMGESYTPELSSQKIMLLGLYGAGKTTTAAKLAKFYQDRGLSALIICCDTQRPAAYEQLESLAQSAKVAFYGEKGEADPTKIVKNALLKYSDKKVIICDTAGRNALDSNLIEEAKSISRIFRPDSKILVISADIGQSAGEQATRFKEAVGVDGIIVTRMDGSGKGGGALSAANASGAKVKFITTGEKLSDIKPYESDKFIGNLLGIPDIGSLVEKVREAMVEADINPEDANVEELNFETFYSQLKAMSKMGPLKNIFGMLGAVDIPKDVIDSGEEKLAKDKVIIASMTPEERKNEKLLHQPSRIIRIAKGSGTSEKDVHQLLSDFNKMKKIFNSMKNDRSLKKRFGGIRF
ncbi:MAG: signal recognition particle receptor subunit alpha [Candidatus Micrarchaeaceae archaeon]